jgi:hypothetical protein
LIFFQRELFFKLTFSRPKIIRISLQIITDISNKITEVNKSCTLYLFHFIENLNKYSTHIIYVKNVTSTIKLLLETKKFLGNKGTGPQLIHAAAITTPNNVDNSKTQKDANPLYQSFLSPRVNFPNWVLLQFEIPQI